MTKLLVLQGANMAYLGRRQPELYGTTTAAELDQRLLALRRDDTGLATIGFDHRMAEASQRASEGVAQVLVVIDDKDFG